MENITQNKRFSPSEITGTLEMDYSIDRVASVLSNMEDFEAVAPDKFMFVNDDPKDRIAINRKEGTLKDFYRKIIVTLVPKEETKCTLHLVFYRKDYSIFFRTVVFSSAFIMGWGSLILMIPNIKENIILSGLKALVIPIVAFLWPFAYYFLITLSHPLKSQLNTIEEVFTDKLLDRLFFFNKQPNLDKLIEIEREVK